MQEVQIKTTTLGKEVHAYLDSNNSNENFIGVWMKNGEGYSLFLYNYSVVEYIHFTEIVMELG